MNKIKVNINKYLLKIEGNKCQDSFGFGDGYFVKIYNYNNMLGLNKKHPEDITTDEEICCFLDIDREYYHSVMLNFKGVLIEDELYFRKIRHAKKALKWMEENLESLLIMKKISGH